jgi:chemotaxis protein histidine kinase CheA
MGTLEPIGDAVPEENRALAEALRTLFESLGISMRRYAARCYTDPGTLSRFLKGTRIPPWSFIVTLLAHVAEEREAQTSDETVALLRQLYVRAAGSSAGTKRTADLQRMLEEADEQAREAASLERLLRQALHDSQQQVDQLNVELKALRAVRAADRQTAKAEIELFTSEAQDLRQERDQLKAEIEVLKKQLKEAVNARVLAEERCDQLERQIESVEHKEKEEEPSPKAEVRITIEEAPSEVDEIEKRAAREYAEAQEQVTAAQERITALQSELEEARRERLRKESTATFRDHLIAASPEEELVDSQPRSLAVRLGYGPDQVLRRADAANRVSPEDVRPILARAFDLQTKSEVERTRRLLKSLPPHVWEIFDDIVAHSIKGSTVPDKQKPGNRGHKIEWRR